MRPAAHHPTPGPPPSQQILPWQLLHDLTHAPRVAALHTGKDGGVVTVLDAHSGAALEELRLAGAVNKVRAGAAGAAFVAVVSGSVGGVCQG